MKVFDLQGNEHKLDTRPSTFPLRSESRCKSKIQYQCGQLLKKKFPYDIILEEVSIPGEHLFIDFLIPHKRISIEVQGNQHNEYVPFFHGSKKNFRESQIRDRRKYEWCEINDILLILVSSVQELEDLL